MRYEGVQKALRESNIEIVDVRTDNTDRYWFRPSQSKKRTSRS